MINNDPQQMHVSNASLQLLISVTDNHWNVNVVEFVQIHL
jgi:DNA-binding ferritin-like protein